MHLTAEGACRKIACHGLWGHNLLMSPVNVDFGGRIGEINLYGGEGLYM